MSRFALLVLVLLGLLVPVTALVACMPPDGDASPGQDGGPADALAPGDDAPMGDAGNAPNEVNGRPPEPPRVVSTIPVTGAQGVAWSQPITIEFSRPMDTTSSTIRSSRTSPSGR